MDIFATCTYSFIESVQQINEELVISDDGQNYSDPIEVRQDSIVPESNYQGGDEEIVDDMSDEDIELIATLY